VADAGGARDEVGGASGGFGGGRLSVGCWLGARGWSGRTERRGMHAWVQSPRLLHADGCRAHL